MGAAGSEAEDKKNPKQERRNAALTLELAAGKAANDHWCWVLEVSLTVWSLRLPQNFIVRAAKSRLAIRWHAAIALPSSAAYAERRSNGWTSWGSARKAIAVSARPFHPRCAAGW